MVLLIYVSNPDVAVGLAVLSIQLPVPAATGFVAICGLYQSGAWVQGIGLFTNAYGYVDVYPPGPTFAGGQTSIALSVTLPT